MATKKAIYQYDNGSGWDEIMFKTTADQVVESTSKRFVSDSEKANWNGKANGTHTHNYAGSSSAGGAATSALACSGNSATASTLATARTLTIGNTGKSFNGSGNVSWSLSEIGGSTAITANTLAMRDSAGDITARLMKSTYDNQSTITGAIAYRVNNSTDNYIRFCSDSSAVRTWLGAAASSHTHSYLPLSGGTLTGNLVLNGGKILTSNASLMASSSSNTLMIAGTGGTGMGALYLGSGGTRIYGMSDNKKLFLEGALYNNSTIEATQGFISPNNLGLYGKDTGGNLFKLIYVDSGNNLVIGEANKKKIRAQADLLPFSENYYLGLTTSGQRWKQVCATTASIATSDSRKKENITPILRNKEELKSRSIDENITTFDIEQPTLDMATSEDYYNFMKDRFIPYSYNYKYSDRDEEPVDGLSVEDEMKCCKAIGFVADEYDLENDKVAKEFIFKTDDGLLNYNTGNYTTMVAIALKEAINKIEELKREIEELKSKKVN